MCELLDCQSAEKSGSQYYHGNSRKKTINKMALIFFLFLFLLFKEDIPPLKHTHTHSDVYKDTHAHITEKKQDLKIYLHLDSFIEGICGFS